MSRFFVPVLAWLVTQLVVGCGNGPIPRAKSLAKQAADANPGGSDHSDGSGDDGSSNGSADAGNTDGGGDGASLDAMFKSCHIDPSTPEKELLNLNYTALPIAQKGTKVIIVLPVSYTATINTSLNIKSSMLQTVSANTVNVTVDPAMAQAQGDEEAKKRSGTTTTDLMKLDDRQNLPDASPTWDGVACTVSAATRVTSIFGGATTVADFQPALPASVTPLPDAERYAEELAEPKTFSGITATVLTTSDPSIPAGSKYTGTVTVKKIESSLDVKQSDGTSLTISGDIAFEVDANFGTPAITAALGVKPVTKFFIDTTNHAYKAIVVESGEADLPPVVFIHQ